MNFRLTRLLYVIFAGLAVLSGCGGHPDTAIATCAPKMIVILGSSTAAGAGAYPVSQAWAYRYEDYLRDASRTNDAINLAIAGWTTYNVLPTGSLNPYDRPVVDSEHNITAALSYAPSAIIVNLPSNDVALGFSNAEIEDNYERLAATAAAANVSIWIATPQPRNLTDGLRAQLTELRDWTTTRFGNHTVDFWTTIANSDGTINPAYDSGDGTHLNNAGHSILYGRVVDRGILQALCSQ